MTVSEFVLTHALRSDHRTPLRWVLSHARRQAWLLLSLFIGDAPTFAVVIVGFTFIYITRTVIENLKAVGGTLGMFGLPGIAATPAGHRWAVLGILFGEEDVPGDQQLHAGFAPALLLLRAGQKLGCAGVFLRGLGPAAGFGQVVAEPVRAGLNRLGMGSRGP
mgnify:CR=1 FL=1